MDNSYRQLYLYAANTMTHKGGSRKANKKEDSLRHLMQLLQKKGPSLPVASLQDFTTVQTQNTQNIAPEQQIQKQQIMKRSYLFLPKVSQLTSIARKQQIEREKEIKAEEQIQKYIEEYVQKIEDEDLVNKYDHSKLVAQAVNFIREKMMGGNLKLKKTKSKAHKTHAKSQINKLRNQNNSIQKLHYYTPSASEIQPHKSFLPRTKQTIQHKFKSSVREWSNQTYANSIYKKQQSNAHDNLYRIDIERINKNSAIRDRERRRSQRNFIRKLSKEPL